MCTCYYSRLVSGNPYAHTCDQAWRRMQFSGRGL